MKEGRKITDKNMIEAEIIYIFYQVKQMNNRNIKKKNSSREK